METFEKVKWMQLPRDVLIGHGVLEEISRVCKHLGMGKEAVIVTGVHHTKKIAGERVLEILSEAGYEVSLEEVPSISVESMEHVKNVSSVKKAKFILGVGGGSVIDTAKIASFELGIPFISVPTIASHDGIVSPRASMKDKDKGNTVSIQAQAPLAVVADTKIISSAPYRFTAAGCGDLLANYTAIRDWRLAQRLRNAEFSSYAAALSEMTANMIMENVTEIKQKDEQSAWIVVKALVSSGVAISIAGSSTPASGSEHKFSHALDMIAEKPALHGEQCGVGTIMMTYLHGENWQRVKAVLKEIGAPTTAKDLGIKEEHIIEALTLAHKINPSRYTILGDSGLTYEAAERLAVVTGVIE
uniref:Glycerol-1-phosphate dehydrogenase [NAD(P)+] n=1 Tax=Candidatus Methanophagaceae archaeon ANME-1 ERB6 TaxID=2759912 RepID=A0A7G9YY86_9EURY|nr:glycerol-1-phosphate dehydrogenase [NAD(P)+] [Methanosarcinales archaeon ANME-1 ERB6]